MQMAIGRADELGQIRRVGSGATRSLRDFRRALTGVRRIMIKAVQLEGREVHKRNARRYARGQYADRSGALRSIRPYGPQHAKRKARLRLDMRPGVMRKGILKTMQSPLGFVRRPDGFMIDLNLPNITVTGRATVGKSKRAIAGKRVLAGRGKNRKVVAIGVNILKTNRRSFRVNDYIGHFADAKAPGLGNITMADQRAINKAGKEAIEKHLQTIQGASRALSARAAIKLKLDVRRMFA
jgi:hypothetical protein